MTLVSSNEAADQLELGFDEGTDPSSSVGSSEGYNDGNFNGSLDWD